MVKGTYIALVLLMLMRVSVLYGQDTYGLKFRSTLNNIDDRTSFQLFDEGDFKFRNHFHLSFDFRLSDLEQFGYICRFVENEQEICLIYYPYAENNAHFFDISIRGKQRILRLPVEFDAQNMKEWLKLDLAFKIREDSISLSIGDNSIAVPFDFDRSYSPKLVFGCYKTSLALPAINIKDIRVVNAKGKLMHYPCNEYSGTKACDSQGRNEVEIVKPDWLAKQHHYWSKECEFVSNSLAGNCFIPERDEIYLVGTDSIIVYNILTNSLSTLDYANAFPLAPDHYNVVYNPLTRKIDAYVFNEGEYAESSKWITSLNVETLQWEEPQLLGLVPKHWHHNQLFLEEYNYPVLFGGFGQMRYFDQFRTYSSDTESWSEVSFSGDAIPPRFLASLSQRVNGRYFLFGGFGSETGEQSLGGYNYYDLYEIDTRARKIKKRWEMERPAEEFVGVNSMVFLQEDSSVHVLSYQHHIAHTHLVLNRFSLGEPGYKTVSDSIPLTSLSIASQSHLFYSETGGKLIAAIREDKGNGTAGFRYYSLLFPPLNINQEKVEPEVYKSEKYGIWKLIIGGFLLLLIVILFSRLWAKKYHAETTTPNEPDKDRWDEQSLKQVLPNKNLLRLFGEFKAMNNKGQNITHLFSPKLQELLYLILCTQLKNKEGISSSQISLALWPDKEIKESKNIRNVTFNHLRNALHDIEGLEIIYENKHWKIAFDENVFIDLVHCNGFTGQKVVEVDLENVELLKFLAYTSKGNFGRDVHNESLDNLKFEIDSCVIDNLVELISNLWSNKKNTEMGLFASSIILKMDTFNETAALYKLKFLTRLGKVDLANQFYQKFTQKFEKHFQQAPSFNLNDVNKIKG